MKKLISVSEYYKVFSPKCTNKAQHLNNQQLIQFPTICYYWGKYLPMVVANSLH